jgi:hypothetical protein
LSKKVSKKCYLLIGSEISRSEKESIPSDKEVSSESSDDDCIFDLSDAAARKRVQRKLQKSLRRRKARESLPVTCAVPASSSSVDPNKARESLPVTCAVPASSSSVDSNKAQESLPVTCAVPASSCSVEQELDPFPQRRHAVVDAASIAADESSGMTFHEQS